MTQIDHDDALAWAREATDPSHDGINVAVRPLQNVARAYLDLHDTLKSWQLGFEQDAKWAEMQAELADLRLIAEASEAWLKAHEWNIGHDRQVHQVDRLRAVGHADNAAREAFKMALTTWRTRTEKT